MSANSAGICCHVETLVSHLVMFPVSMFFCFSCCCFFQKDTLSLRLRQGFTNLDLLLDFHFNASLTVH